MEDLREQWQRFRESLDWEDVLVLVVLFVCVGALIIGGSDTMSASCSFESHPSEGGLDE